MLFPSGEYFDEEEIPIYSDYCDDISCTFIERARKKWGLICEGIGGGCIDQVNSIGLKFNKDEVCTLEQARAILVESNEEFVALINSHKLIRPFLSHYPYTKTGAKLSVSFVRPSKTSRKAIDYAFIVRETIHYSYYNIEKQKLIIMNEEPYKEAKKIVENLKDNDLFQISEVEEPEKTQT